MTDSEELPVGDAYPAVPEIPDPPSYAPIFTGLGITVTAWGFLTNFFIIGFGLLVFLLGLRIWIKELSNGS